jgi:hypothetical protein
MNGNNGPPYPPGPYPQAPAYPAPGGQQPPGAQPGYGPPPNAPAGSPYPAQGAPYPGSYGAPAPYPQQPAAGYPAPGAPYGSPYGAAPPYPYQQGAAPQAPGSPYGMQPGPGSPYGMQPGAYPAPVQPQSWAGPPVVQGPSGYDARAIGLFEPIPCPHCGAPTHSASSTTARYAGGLLGMLLYGAIVARYTCTTHGEIPKTAFPPQHASSIDMRRLLKLGGALVCIGLLFFLLLLRVML